MRLKKKIIKMLVCSFVAVSGLLLSGGCGIYTFTGASIPPEAKTFSVSYFPNMATLVVQNLDNMFTNALVDRFLRQTRLSMVPSDGDLAFEGEIRGYTVAPVAIAGEVAQQNRYTLTVRVSFTSKYGKENNFDKSFSRFVDYPTSQSFSVDMLEQAIDELIEDIFNASVANW